MPWKRPLQIGLTLFLVLPYLLLIKSFGVGFQVDAPEFLWALKNTTIQATISGLLSILLGVIFSFGYFRLSHPRHQQIFMITAMAPNFVPPLFILLSVLQLVDPMPRGLLAISFVHILINAGFCSAFLVGIIEAKVLPFQESAYVLGVSRWQFMRKILWPLMKSDFLFLFAFVFTVCFSSFSIPLILGGGKGTTLQVLIYEKMRISQDWSSALSISFMQSALLLLMGFLIQREPAQKLEIRPWTSRLLSSTSALVLFAAFHLVLLYGYLDVIFDGWDRVLFSDFQFAPLLTSFLNSVYLGLLVALVIFVILSLFSICLDRNWFQRFLDSYSTPSTAFVGFVFLIVWPADRDLQILRLAIALSFIFVPYLLKLYLVPKINLLVYQQEVAYVLGARPLTIWIKVIWPQILPEIGQASALAGAWAVGDFALSRMMLIANDTLALETESLMTSYRLPLAGFLSLFLLILGVATYYVVRKLVYVFGEALRARI